MAVITARDDGRCRGWADHLAMTSIGPVQFVAVGFPEEATYEGRILAEIESIEASGSLRVLDVLFVRKDASTGDLQTMDIQSDELQALAGDRDARCRDARSRAWATNSRPAKPPA
jgi:hypothetical protein